jgi:hypothetical protein
MTTELEQEFFRVFGIEPKIDYDYKTVIQNVTKTGYWFDKEYLIEMFNDNQKFKVIQVRKDINYPKITAEKLLEMICIYNSTYTNGYTNYSLLTERDVEKLKEQILKNCLIVKDDIKQQIQQLFKEEKGIIDNNV